MCICAKFWQIHSHMWLDLQKPSLTAQEMKSSLLLIFKLIPLHYLEIPSTCLWMAKSTFTDSLLPTVSNHHSTTVSVGLVNGINKGVTSARLLPTTVSTCPVDYIPFCHLLKTQHCCLCPYGRLNPPPATPYNVRFVILQLLWKSCSKPSSVS